MKKYVVNRIPCKRCGKEIIGEVKHKKYCGDYRVRGTCAYYQHLSRIIVYRQSEKYRETLRRSSKDRRLRLRFRILSKFNFTCQYCGRKAPGVVLEIDHIAPKFQGGKNHIDNYTVACKECNLGKGDLILDEFKDGG